MRNSTYGNNLFFSFLLAVIKLFKPKYRVEGQGHVSGNHPAVFLCNHMKVSGPVVMLLHFPFRCRPWVIEHMLGMRNCMNYLERRFIREVLRIKRRPFNRMISFIMALFCTNLMKAVKAIPTYRGTSRARLTFEETITAIQRGQNILIFPEDNKIPYSDHLNDFFGGFAHLGKMVYKSTGVEVVFHPVFVDRATRKIHILKAERFQGSRNFKEEKERIVAVIRNAINGKALEICKEKCAGQT